MKKTVLILMAVMVILTSFAFVSAQNNETANQTLPYVDQAILIAFENQTWVEIMVKLNEINDSQTLEEKKKILDNTIDSILSTYSESEFKLKARFISGRQFYGNITKAGFDKLINNPNIAEIYLPPPPAHVSIPFVGYNQNISENESSTENQTETKSPEITKPQSFFQRIVNFFKSFFNKIFNIPTEEPEALVNLSEENKNNAGNINEDKNITTEITSNITCGYCQYVSNDTCPNYSCCSDSECNANETCSNNECIPLNCTSNQYAENHTCIDYECSKNEDCSVNQICFKDGPRNECLNKDCPTESCDDGIPCTEDYCYNGNCTHAHDTFAVCCGDDRCDITKGENETSCPRDCSNTSKFFYCENDCDCVPSCGSNDYVKSYGVGVCINKNYTSWDVESLYNPRLCDPTYEAGPRQCIECSKCKNNQCVTKVVECTDNPQYSPTGPRCV